MRYHRLLLIALDACIVNAAILAALWLRFDGEIPAIYLSLYLSTVVMASLVALSMYYLFGLYNRVWEHASIEALTSIFLAVTLSSVIFGFLTPFLTHRLYPRSVLAIYWLLSLLLVGGSRFSWRLLREKLYRPHHLSSQLSVYGLKKVLIYGAGQAGAALATQILVNPDCDYELKGFVDDDPRKKNLRLRGIPILGSGKDLPAIVSKRKPDEVIIAIPSASGEVVRRIVDFCKVAGIPCKILPSLLQLMDGKVSLEQLRKVEVEDLLGRQPAELQPEKWAGYLGGKHILVTGAGGSIGSELCRQICHFGPGQLLLLGRGENRIHRIHQELSSHFPELDLVPIVGSFTIASCLRSLFQFYRPEIIFHAGAHKHVPLMERYPREAVWNNVIGTELLAQFAVSFHSEKFVLISTDKAVNPIGVMGITKKLAEAVCDSQSSRNDTDFCVVRFGNVLGSDGSVLQLWRQQLAAGLPLLVTHPDATRYFMTVHEAALLVLAAASCKPAGTFLLNMGTPLKIIDLAKQLLRLSGIDSADERCIQFTGLRAGEKLHEELLAEGEYTLPTDINNVLRIQKRNDWVDSQQLRLNISSLKLVLEDADPATLKRVLQSIAAAPSFQSMLTSDSFARVVTPIEAQKV